MFGKDINFADWKAQIVPSALILIIALLGFFGWQCKTTESNITAKEIKTEDLSQAAREAILCAQFLTSTNKNGGDQAGKELVCKPIFDARGKALDEERLKERFVFCKKEALIDLKLDKDQFNLCWERLNPVK